MLNIGRWSFFFSILDLDHIVVNIASCIFYSVIWKSVEEVLLLSSLNTEAYVSKKIFSLCNQSAIITPEQVNDLIIV